MALLSFDLEYFIQVIKEKLSNKVDRASTLSGYGITNAYTKTEIDNMLTNTGYTKIDFTTTSSWVSGDIGFKLTLQYSGGKSANVYHNLGNNKFEPVIVGIEIQSNNVIIESFEKFNGYIVIL